MNSSSMSRFVRFIDGKIVFDVGDDLAEVDAASELSDSVRAIYEARTLDGLWVSVEVHGVSDGMLLSELMGRCLQVFEQTGSYGVRSSRFLSISGELDAQLCVVDVNRSDGDDTTTVILAALPPDSGYSEAIVATATWPRGLDGIFAARASEVIESLRFERI